MVDPGGLMSSRPSSYELWRRPANVDNILRGRKARRPSGRAADQIELVANFKTAKELGLTIPQSILARVYEVME